MKVALVQATKAYSLFPPLGLVSIATYVGAKRPGFADFRIMNVNLPGDVFKELAEFAPDVIGLSSMTLSYGDVVSLAAKIRESFPRALLVIGGPHVSTCPESLEPVFDAAVLGEGEATTLELLDEYERAGLRREALDRSKVAGLAFLDGAGNLQKTSPRGLIANIDDIPRPDRSFLSAEYSRPAISPSIGEFAPKIHGHMMSSRGCPFNCMFCSTKALWGRHRLFSAERVAEEIEELVLERGASVVHMWDDFFVMQKSRLEKIIEILDRRGVLGKAVFDLNMQSRVVSDELCGLFSRLGVINVALGLESGSPPVLAMLKGGRASVEDNYRAVDTLDRHGVGIMATFIFGSPGETIADMRLTLKMMRHLAGLRHVNVVHFGMLTPLPGTPLWEMAKAKGLVADRMDWSRLNIGHTVSLADRVKMEGFFADGVDKTELVAVLEEAAAVVRGVNEQSSLRFERKMLKSAIRKLSLRKLANLALHPAKLVQGASLLGRALLGALRRGNGRRG